MKVTRTGIYVRNRDTYIKNPAKGALDIYACLPPNGRSCWIEVKKPGDRVRPRPAVDYRHDELVGGIGVRGAEPGGGEGKPVT
jgi:hypothetical protein